ncbi:MAG: BatD family protein, partial [Planctomycetota bacterium]|nr:BatD family protein [Planctomycetota bacterium]
AIVSDAGASAMRGAAARSIFGAAAIAVMLLVTGCGEGGGSERTDAAAVTQSHASDSLRVTVSVDHDAITVAEVVTLRIGVEVEEGWRVTPPLTDAESLGEFTILERAERMEVVGDGGGVRRAFEFTLEPFLEGEYVIPAIEIRAEHAGEAGETIEVETDEIEIAVRSVAPEDAEIASIKPVADPPPNVWLAWGVIAGSLAGVILLAVLAGAMIQRSRRPAPPLPAHEAARQRLIDLLGGDLLASGRYKAFYNELSLILRQYIEDRFALAAPERTTEEFLHESAASRRFTAEQERTLRAFLSHCDLVKFAELQPDEAQVNESVATVQRFIESTIPDESDEAGSQSREEGAAHAA